LKQIAARVVSNVVISPGYRRADGRILKESRLIWLNCPEIATGALPGQFLMIKCGINCTLPRPFSIFRTYKGDLAIFYAVYEDGKGTEWLAERRTGDIINLLGPLGNGFTVNPETRNLLLVGGGIGVAPLYFLAQDAVAHLCSVTFLYGTATRGRYPLPAEFKPVQATEDGSLGHKGYVTELIPQYTDKADQIFMCGPLSMFKTVYNKRNELKLTEKKVQVSLEIKMGCGAGVCYSCTIHTAKGLKQVCKDGPVFNLEDVLWDKLTG
jgi:dihydroorotate dehydrogenase electron transfer subunit